MHRIALLACLAAIGCQSSAPPPPAADEGVRQSARAYVEALRGERWARACTLMTRAARAALREQAGGSCTSALAGGATLTPGELAAIGRQVPGARVEVRGARATLGPLGVGELSLVLERRGGRWLVAG